MLGHFLGLESSDLTLLERERRRRLSAQAGWKGSRWLGPLVELEVKRRVGVLQMLETRHGFGSLLRWETSRGLGPLLEL